MRESTTGDVQDALAARSRILSRGDRALDLREPVGWGCPRERDGGMDGAALMVAAVSFYHSCKLILPE